MPEYLKDISIVNHDNKALELEIRSDKGAWHIYFDVLANMSDFLRQLQLNVNQAIVDVQLRDAQLRIGADDAGQPCPSCGGKGERYITRYYPEECDVCKGTGQC